MSLIELRQEGAVATLTFADAARKNAISLAFCEELQLYAKALERDESVRAIVLRAEGTAFSVGGDIKELVAERKHLAAHLDKMTSAIHEAVRSLRRAPAPIIAAVDGVAAGGGLSLVLVADYVVASPKARFVAAYTRSGLSPDTGLSWFLPRRVGHGKAFDMIALNPTLDANEAEKIGLVQRIADDVDAAATEVATAIATLPSAAGTVVKKLLDAVTDHELASHLDREAKAIAEIAVQPETQAKLDAFLKR